MNEQNRYEGYMDHDWSLYLKHLLSGCGRDQAKLNMHVNSITKPISLHDTLQMKFYNMLLLLVSKSASLVEPLRKTHNSDINQGGN